MITNSSIVPQRLGRPDRTIHLLSATSGGADIVAFLQFHMVFTSAMTGNLALFGIAVGQGHLFSATHSLTALLGFTAGIIIASFVKGHTFGLRTILAIETGSLGIYALLWILCGSSQPGNILYTLITLSALSMGMQSVAARLVNVAGVPSVVFTSTMTSMVITFVESVRNRGRLPFTVRRQSSAVVAYLAGAISFSFFLTHFPTLSMVLPALLVLTALVIHWKPEVCS